MGLRTRLDAVIRRPISVPFGNRIPILRLYDSLVTVLTELPDLSRNEKIKVYETIVWSVEWKWCGAWFVALSDDHRLGL
jgi:hypothetical protein